MLGLPLHHLIWLLAACGAVDLDTVFFDGVEAERSYDYDLQREVLDVAATGLPHHKFDLSFAISLGTWRNADSKPVYFMDMFQRFSLYIV